jgi:site-specific DNA-cytosine methylase
MNAQTKIIPQFFAGIGLMRIGLENASCRIVFANDIDHDKWQTTSETVRTDSMLKHLDGRETRDTWELG